MRGVVLVDARDDYRVAFALTEFDPAFTDREILLADRVDGRPLDESTGPWQIVVPGEKRHARWVRMVKTVRVLDAAWAIPDMK